MSDPLKLCELLDLVANENLAYQRNTDMCTPTGILQQYDAGIVSAKPFFPIHALVTTNKESTPGEGTRVKFEVVAYWFDCDGTPVDRPVEYLKQLRTEQHTNTDKE